MIAKSAIRMRRKICSSATEPQLAGVTARPECHRLAGYGKEMVKEQNELFWGTEHSGCAAK